MICRLLLGLVLLPLGTARAGPPSGSPAAEAESAGAIRFRRLFVPADRVEDWPRGEAKYMPMASGEFERLLAIAQSPGGDVQPDMAVRSASARYQASLHGDQWLVGEAILEVQHAIKTPALLTLDPCNLAISHPHWGESETVRAALGAGEDGKLRLLVERSGRLQFGWSLGARRDASGGLAFSFDLPPCPICQLILDLPSHLTPVVDRGLVLGSDPADDGLRRWRIELGGHGRFGLRLISAVARPRQPGLATVRQSATYAFSPRGVEVTVQLKLDAHNEPLLQVPLLLDPPLQLATATCGDAPVAWSAASAREGEGTRLVLMLPGPVREGTAELQLKALAPLVTDQPWKLPRVIPNGLFWQEGNVRLTVPAPLSIEHLQLSGCRQSAYGPLSASQAGESLQVECFSPDAAVEVVLAQPTATVRWAGGTVTDLASGKMTSHVVADFRTLDAAQFLLQADVTPQWTVDSIESQPAEAIEDWSTDPRSGRRRLSIRLAKPLTTARPVRIMIVARRLHAAPSRKLGIEDLVPLRFLPSLGSKQLVAIRPVGAYELKLSGAERLHQISPRDLTAAELDLFAAPPGELLFQDDSGAAKLQVTLQSRKPRYSGTMRVEASLNGQMFQESYLLRCTPPKPVRVDRVVAHFSQRRGVPPRWSLEGEDEGQLSARPWSPRQQAAAGYGAEGETWELTLRRPRREPFEIRATRETRLTAPQPVSLVSLPDAAQQQATLVLRCLGPERLQIDNNRLKPAPADSGPPGRYQTLRAAYQYDPLGETSSESGPAVVVSVLKTATTATAWVWDCECQSRYAADGTAQHLAIYRLQSAGRGRMRLGLPPNVTRQDVQGLWVDGNRFIACSCGDQQQDVLSVDLPQDEKFPTVAIHWSTHARPPSIVGQVQPSLPEVDLPVLSQHWTLWLPPGYIAPEFQADARAARKQRLAWYQRLFGIVGRDEEEGGAEEPPASDAPAATENSAAARPDAWAPAGLPGYEPADTTGWTAYRLEIPEATSLGVTIVHQSSVRLAGWIVFLMVIALGSWPLRQRPALLMGLAAALGVVALAVPVSFVPIASGGLLGLVFCLAREGIRRLRPERSPSTEEGPREKLASTVAAVIPFSAPLLAATMILLGATAQGAETAEKGPREKPAPAPYSVFIPVDERQKPSGGKYYVSEAFYDQLHRWSAARAEKPQGWLLIAATYRASLSREVGAGRLMVDDLSADFDLHVFAPVRVRIPLRHEEVSLVPDESLLDGRPVQPEWEPDGGTLALEIADPGEYRLELSLRPGSRGPDGPPGLDFAIPRLAASRLELTVPAGAPAIEVPSAGSVHWEDEPARWVADLGPANRLTARWHDAAGGAGEAPAIDAEQWLWLKIEPGSVQLDAKLKLRVAAGQLRRLQMAVDPSLQLMPPAGTEGPTVHVRTPPGQPQLVEFEWPHPLSDAAVVDVHFLCTGTSSLGNLRVPQLDVLDARTTGRWLGVSIDQALEHQMQGLPAADAIAVPEFLGGWGTTDAAPLFACRLSSGLPAWTIATRPRQVETTVDQMLTLLFDSNDRELRFDAQLATTGGQVFQHRLLVPRPLRVESVSVMAGGVQRVARWSQSLDRELTVFLNGPVTGRHELSLRGHLPALPTRKVPLGLVQIENAEVRSSLVHLFRSPSVLVEMDRVAGLVELKEPAVAPSGAEWMRVVQSFRVEGTPSVRAMLQITPNRPEVRAEQITRLIHEDDGWKAAVDCRLDVSGGVIDDLRIDAPEPWNGPYKISPAAAIKVVEDSAGPRHLMLRPRTAIAGRYQFTVTSPLAVPPSDRTAAPSIVLLPGEQVKRFLVLPRNVEGQPVAWDTQGLREAKLPDGPPDNETAAYEVVNEPFRAVLRSAASEQDVARVRLADIHIAWQPDGSWQGAAVFDIQPGKLSLCPLWLPPGCRLVYAAVAGLPVDPMPAGPHAWRLPLDHAPSPTRVEVLYAGGREPEPTPVAAAADVSAEAGGESAADPEEESPEPLFGISSASRRFLAPRLGDLPVGRTQWTIAGPAAYGPGIVVDPETQSDDASASESTAEIAALWQSQLDPSHTITQYGVQGVSDSITVGYRPGADEPLAPRLIAAALLLLLAGAGALLLHRDVFHKWLAQIVPRLAGRDKPAADAVGLPSRV